MSVRNSVRNQEKLEFYYNMCRGCPDRQTKKCTCCGATDQINRLQLLEKKALK